MPFSIFIALLIAFVVDSSGPKIPASSVSSLWFETASGIALVAGLAFGLGCWVANRVFHFGYASGKVLRRYTQGSRLVTAAGLGVRLDHPWRRLVAAGPLQLGLAGDGCGRRSGRLRSVRRDPALDLERIALRRAPLHKIDGYPGLWVCLGLKTRQAVGLVLPVVLIFLVRQDFLDRLWPAWQRNPVAEPLELAALGLLVLIASPLFIRLAWPTSGLPDGPLRRRLHGVAQRAGFRFNDLLIWDTRHMMINACVTGVLPGFRYVLLSDALIDSLSPVEVAAVFGHEVGHVAHRHLPFFGFFFVGSLGVLALAARVFSFSETWITSLSWIPADLFAPAGDLIEGTAILGFLGLFFFVVFGQLSRRFRTSGRCLRLQGRLLRPCRMPTAYRLRGRSPHRDARAVPGCPTLFGWHRDLCPRPGERRRAQRHRRRPPVVARQHRVPDRVSRTVACQPRQRIQLPAERSLLSLRAGRVPGGHGSIAILTRSWELLS